jgi:hypothetical protein
MPRTLVALASALLSAALLTGCPHRSPLWSPDGAKILLLGGKPGEEVDKPASRLWLVDVAKQQATELQCPAGSVRYLSADWIDAASFVVLTGKWTGDFIEKDSEKVWTVNAASGAWKALELPPPGEARSTRHPVVVAGGGPGSATTGRLLVYPSSDEAVVVASLASGKVLQRLEPAELVGPGPEDGFLVSRPSPEDSGTIEVAALGPDLKVLWRKKLSELREAIARRYGKPPVEIVFNETSTSRLPPAGESGWVGLELVFSDVSWKEGIAAFFLQLDAKTGDVQQVARGTALSGRASASAGLVWTVLAPDAKAKLPVRLETIDLANGQARATVPFADLPKEAVHGYALDPAGKRFALAICGAQPHLRIFSEAAAGKETTIELPAQ